MREDRMKESIEIAGRDYDSRKRVHEKFDIDYTTIANWVKNGLLPTPLRLGNRLYFDRTEVETRLLATGAIGQSEALLTQAPT
jgi:hypothetical protein